MSIARNKYSSLALVLLLNIFGTANADQTWKFKVYLDDKEIGEHTFTVATHQDKTHVNIKANFNVYFLFINAYQYTHKNYEIWSNQCLQSVHSITNDNGEELYVQGGYNDEQFKIQTSSGQFTTEGCIQTFAYWNPNFLKSKKLLNAQTGELTPVAVENLGNENIIVRNKLTSASRYRLITEEFVIDLWYSENNEWLALNSTTSNGSILRYRII